MDPLMEAQQEQPSSKKMPLTESALGLLDREVAQARSVTAAPPSKHAVFTPDLERPQKTSSKVAESNGIERNLEAFTADINGSQPQQPQQQQTDDHISMTNPPSYIVDGIVYRSPETLGTLIEIRESEGRGLGIFALKDIPANTLILSERPLVKLNDDGCRVDPLDTLVNGLAPDLKRAYRQLHGYRPFHKGMESLNRRILYSNGFAIEKTTTAVFKVASRFNHSCIPNAEFAWNEELDRMEYFTAFKLLEGEEITIDYGHKKGHLKKYYGFECVCGGCTEWGSASSSNGLSDALVKGKEEMLKADALVVDSSKRNGTENSISNAADGTNEPQKEVGNPESQKCLKDDKSFVR